MLAESACIPIPSEATMLFAGFAVAEPAGAFQGHTTHHLTLLGIVAAGGARHLRWLGIVAAGVAGNPVGSWSAYAVGRYGRLELVERYGHVLHINQRSLAR